MKMIFATILVSLSLAGCSKESLYEGVYEGVRVQQRLEKAPEPLADDEILPTYERYNTIRKKNENE